MSLEIIPLGIASAFAKEYGQSNFLIGNGGPVNPEYLAFDFGTQWPLMIDQYCKANKKPDWPLWLKNFYLSHNHADHNGGGEEMFFSTFFNPKVAKPNLYGNGRVLQEAWDGSWRAGAGSLSWGQLPPEERDRPISLSTYTQPHYLMENESFNIAGNKYEPFVVEHVRNRLGSMPCYGVLITTQMGTTIMITSDTQFNPTGLLQMYDQVDWIWHDCETGPFSSGVHSHIKQLMTLPERVTKKMIPYHWNEKFPLTAEEKAIFAFIPEIGKSYTYV